MHRDFNDTLVAAARGKVPLDKDILLIASDEINHFSEQIKSYDASSVSLYFDIKENIDNPDSFQDTLSTISNIMALGSSLEINSKNNNITEEDQIKALKLFIQSMITVSEILKSIEDDISENLRVIKPDINQLPTT